VLAVFLSIFVFHMANAPILPTVALYVKQLGGSDDLMTATVLTAQIVKVEDRPEPDELLDLIKNMARFDLGNVAIEVGPSGLASMLGKPQVIHRAEILRQKVRKESLS
jgi:hypothetical protein